MWKKFRRQGKQRLGQRMGRLKTPGKVRNKRKEAKREVSLIRGRRVAIKVSVISTSLDLIMISIHLLMQKGETILKEAYDVGIIKLPPNVEK